MSDSGKAPDAVPDPYPDTFVGDFIGSRVTHIVWEARDRRGWGKAVCGVKGNMPLATPTPEVSCKRCMAWARKNRPEHVEVGA